MPASTKKQQKFTCVDLARLRRRQETKTGMSERQLREFCKSRPKRGKRRR